LAADRPHKMRLRHSRRGLALSRIKVLGPLESSGFSVALLNRDGSVCGGCGG
jgi:hypothetical protein